MAQATCSVSTCPAKVNAKGLCDGHYRRWRKTGDAQPDVPLMQRIPAGAVCNADACDRPVKCQGYCTRHYNLWHLYGSVEDRPRGRGPRTRKGIYRPGDKSPREWVTCKECGTSALVLLGGGGYCSQACFHAARRGPDHPRWVESGGSKTKQHERVYAVRGKADHCSWCGQCDPAIRYHWANLTGNYDDVWDFAQMCPACHGAYDAPLQPRGSRHPHAKLTEAIVAEARRRWAAGETSKALSAEFGVSASCMGLALKRRTWKHVEDEAVAS